MAQPSIVPGSEVSTPISGVKMDSSAFREAALAPGKVAEAIGENVGGFFYDVAQKVQANRNARMVFDADLAMRKTKDDFTANLVKMPDEGTWLPAYKDQVRTLRDTVMSNPQAGPEVRRMLAQKFDVWEAATTAEIRTAALMKGTKETRESAIADSTYAAQQGDLQGAHNTLQAAVEHYAMTPEEAHKISVRFPAIAAKAQADLLITTDPIKAPDLIKKLEGQLDPRDYVSINAHAREARSAAQTSNLNDLLEQMDAAPDGAIDPAVVRQKVKTGEITQRAANGVFARMEKSRNDTAQNDFNIAMMVADDHDFTEDKSPMETARKMKDEAAGFPMALRRRFNAHVDARLQAAEKKGQSEERPIERDALSLMEESRRGGAFVPVIAEKIPAKTHWYKSDDPEATKYHKLDGGLTTLKEMTDEEVKAQFPGFTKSKLIDAEKARYAEVRQKMREWFRDPANKNATEKDANEYRMALEKPFVMESVSAKALPSKQRRLVRQNGKVYDFDTGEEVK